MQSSALHAADSDLQFSVKRTEGTHEQVQQAIKPESVVLVVFGAVAALATLVLTDLAQLISRVAPDPAVLRTLGSSRAKVTLPDGRPPEEVSRALLA